MIIIHSYAKLPGSNFQENHIWSKKTKFRAHVAVPASVTLLGMRNSLSVSAVSWQTNFLMITGAQIAASTRKNAPVLVL